MIPITELPISSIKVGKRFRRDLGDIDTLAESIRDGPGLLQPVVITPDHKLIAGLRRLTACKKLGWKTIPVRIVNLDARLRLWQASVASSCGPDLRA